MAPAAQPNQDCRWPISPGRLEAARKAATKCAAPPTIPAGGRAARTAALRPRKGGPARPDGGGDTVRMPAASQRRAAKAAPAPACGERRPCWGPHATRTRSQADSTGRCLKRAARALRSNSPDTEWHAVRIRAKHCRYAAEAVAPIYGRRAKRFTAAIAALQDLLGSHQDTVVAGHGCATPGRASPQPALLPGN